jgi:hypothetical protein
MPFAMEQDESAYPEPVSLFRLRAEMTPAADDRYLVEQAGRVRGGFTP